MSITEGAQQVSNFLWMDNIYEKVKHIYKKAEISRQQKMLPYRSAQPRIFQGGLDVLE